MLVAGVDVRTPDGTLYRRVLHTHAEALVLHKLADEVRSRSGILRYVRLKKAAATKGFATLASSAHFTVALARGDRQSHLGYEHITARCLGFAEVEPRHQQ
jgi:hypothetical protein